MGDLFRHDGGDGCHRSAGFALYATGIVLWMTLVSCTGSTYIIPLAPDHVDSSVYVIAQQITYVSFYFVVAFATWKRPLKASSHAFIFVVAGAFAVSAGCLVLIYLGFASPLVQGVYGFSMGLAIASGYMQWLCLVVVRPLEEIEQLLVIASVASIASGAVVAFLPLGIRVILFVLVLAPASVLMLSRNTQIGVSEGCFGGTRSPSARVLGRELMVPALCAVVLVLVAPIVSATYYSGGEQPLVRVLFAQGANVIGLGILAFFLFGLKRNVTIFSVYCALLPLLASSVLAASFFEPQQRWFVLLLGDVCFCMVSFLLLLTSCAMAKRLESPITVVYGLLGGCVYLARIPEMLIVVPWGQPPFEFAPFAIAALLLYVLTVPLFFLPLLRHRQRDATRETSVATTADLSAACNVLAKRHRLPDRQAEVLELLANGHGAAYVAEALCLSENTVKTYRKAIYAALGVHSKQELINLVHREASLERS